jgi:transposase
MDISDFLREIIGIDDNFSIKRVERTEDSSVKIHIEYIKSTCTISGVTCKLYDYAPEREWQHLPWFQYRCYIICRLPRYIDMEGNVKTFEPNFASKGKGYTHLFSTGILLTLQKVKVQSTVASLFSTSPYIVRSIMEEAVESALVRRGTVTGLETVSLDEKAFSKGHNYATILIDSKKDYIVEMTEGRSEEHVKLLFYLSTSKTKLNSLRRVNMDMWKPYMNAIKDMAPKAKIVHDKFHLIQKLSEAIDKTRRKEVKSQPMLKKNKYTVLKNTENRTDEQQTVFDRLDKANLQTAQAWHVRENFKALFVATENANIKHKQAKELLQSWMNNAGKKGLEFVNNVVQTIENHLPGVISALTTHSNSGKHENLNGRIQSVLAKARGFRNFERFRINVLFYFGKLDILPLKI